VSFVASAVLKAMGLGLCNPQGKTARMPDVVLLVNAMAIGAIVAGAVLWLTARIASRRGQRSSSFSKPGWSWAIGAGVLAASGATDQWPHWPALEDRARFLTLLIPLAILVATVAAAFESRRATWILRLGLAAVVAPILLHNTVYLADLNGSGSAEWSNSEATLILCGLAAWLAMTWMSLSALQAKTSTQTVSWLMAIDALATAVTVLLSGYFRAGVLGLGLAGSIAGATLASYITPRQLTQIGGLGVSVTGVFSVALMGRFFGALSTELMLCLLVAPLLAWGGELPWLRTLPQGWRTAARVTCVSIPLIVVVIVAQRKFTEASSARSPVNAMQMAPRDSTK
jgi:uncharacterized membrane protein